MEDEVKYEEIKQIRNRAYTLMKEVVSIMSDLGDNGMAGFIDGFEYNIKLVEDAYRLKN